MRDRIVKEICTYSLSVEGLLKKLSGPWNEGRVCQQVYKKEHTAALGGCAVSWVSFTVVILFLLVSIPGLAAMTQECFDYGPNNSPTNESQQCPRQPGEKLSDVFNCSRSISCTKLAHTLGQHAQMEFLTQQNYRKLVNDLGEHCVPVETETGYQYCWECNTKDDQCGKCCLVTGFKGEILGYNWPKAPDPAVPSPPVSVSPSSPPREELVAPPPKKPVPSKEEVQRLTEKADKGDAEAQYQLGLLYRDGLGVAKDTGRAATLFIKAADQGHKPAQKELQEPGVK